MKPSPSLGSSSENAPTAAKAAVSDAAAVVAGAKESAAIALASAAKEDEAAKSAKEAIALVENVDPLAAVPAKPATDDPSAGLDGLMAEDPKPAAAKAEAKEPAKGGEDPLAELAAEKDHAEAKGETAKNPDAERKAINLDIRMAGFDQTEAETLATSIANLAEPAKSEAVRKIQEDPKTFVEWLKANKVDPSKPEEISSTLAKAHRRTENARDVREFQREACLKIIREINPEAAAEMDAAFGQYVAKAEAENAQRVERGEAPVAPMSAGEFATGWFVVNAAYVVAGAPESKRAELSKTLDALRDSDSASVDRFLKEMPDGFSKRSYESGARAAALSVGIENPDHKGKEPVSEKKLKDGTVVRQWEDGTSTETRDGETVMRGPKGSVVVRKDGVTVLDRDGKVSKRVSAERPGTTLVHGIGYPVSNAGREPGDIEKRTKAAEFWCGMAENGGFPFVSGGLMKTFEGVMRTNPALSDGVVFRAEETDVPPTWKQMDAMATFFERSVGLEKGTIFDRDRGFSMRVSFRSECGGVDPETYLRNRFYNGWNGEDGKWESGPAWSGSIDRARLMRLLADKKEENGKDAAGEGAGKK
jgi:hypothetical protein